MKSAPESLQGRPSRRMPRRRVDPALLALLGEQLTDRDRQIALDCYDHRLLTTEQLRRLHFTSPRVAQKRLRRLYELRVLERFQPPWQRGEGATPYHWLLDEAGAHVVAELLGEPREQLRWRRDVALALARSTARNHQLAVNELVTLLAEELASAGGALREWWGERRARPALGGLVEPDGYLRLQLPAGDELSLLLELDRGNEDYERLREKAARYARALPRSQLAARQPIVLLLVPTQARAKRAAGELAATGAPLGVAAWSADQPRSPLALLRQLPPAQPRPPANGPARKEPQ